MGSKTVWDMTSAEIGSPLFNKCLLEGWEPFSVVLTRIQTPIASSFLATPQVEVSIVEVVWFKRPHDFDADAKEITNV